MRLLLAASSSPSNPDLFTSLAEEILATDKGFDNKQPLREDRLAFLGWENELDVLDALEEMLESKAEALGAVNIDEIATDPEQDSIRPEVREMIRIYRKGA